MEPVLPIVQHTSAPQEKTRRRSTLMLYAAAAGVVVAGALWYGLSWWRGAPSSSRAAESATTTSQSAVAAAPAPQPIDKAADAIAKVGKLIELPQGETPTVATVTDPDKLKAQAFFVNAKAGDIVLLYTIAHKAYLYDPLQNILVDVAPISTAAATTTP